MSGRAQNASSCGQQARPTRCASAPRGRTSGAAAKSGGRRVEEVAAGARQAPAPARCRRSRRTRRRSDPSHARPGELSRSSITTVSALGQTSRRRGPRDPRRRSPPRPRSITLITSTFRAWTVGDSGTETTAPTRARQGDDRDRRRPPPSGSCSTCSSTSAGSAAPSASPMTDVDQGDEAHSSAPGRRPAPSPAAP